MKIRRVVTGHAPNGKSVVVSDIDINAITIALASGSKFCRLWEVDSVPTLPVDNEVKYNLNYFPPAGGYRFGLFTVPPESIMSKELVDMETALKEAEKKLPGLVAHMEPDNPGMHTTDSIDLAYIISGEVWLELDDGKMTHLFAGTTIVQNGTRHAWRNKSKEACVILVCLIGTKHG